jgi:ribosomal protein S18 acetylase RimI-like enzyme
VVNFEANTRAFLDGSGNWMMRFGRPFSEETAALAALHVQCWREAYAEFLPMNLLSSFSTQKRLPLWQAVIPNTERFVLAAYIDENPCGFIISGSTDEKHIENQDGHVWAIYIEAEHHRKGIGRELISRAAGDWLTRGGHSMTVGVLAENVNARAFYEKLGARLVRTGTYEWDGYKLEDAIYVFENLPSLIP